MEEAWHVKCSSGRLQPPPPPPPFHPPPAGSGNQMNMNMQQFVYPVLKQVTNQRIGQMLQEPLLPPALNTDFGKSGNAEMGNSFLALLSGNLHNLSSELLPSTNSRTELVNLPVANGDTFGQSASHHFSATCVPHLTKNQSTETIINGELSSFIASQPLFSTSSKAPDVQSNLQALDSHSQFLCSPKFFSRHTFEDMIRCGVQSRKCGSPPLSSSKNAIQYQDNQASHKAPADANVYGLIPSSLFFRGHPRVLCMNTTGELFVNDMGLLAVLCCCHGMPMSVAKFCQHSGLSSANPQEAIRMENGMTLGEWCKMCFGNLPPGDSRGLDWSKYSSTEFGSKAFSFPSLSKNHGIVNSAEAFGGLGRSGDFLKNSLYAHHPNLVGHTFIKKPMNNDIVGEKRNSEENGVHLTRITGLAQKAVPVISENYKVQAVKGIPELKGLYSTPNKQKTDINSQLFANNTYNRAKSGITSVSYAPSAHKDTFNYDKNTITQAYSSNETFIVDRDGSDLRLGQPSQHKNTSLSSFPTAIDLQFQAAFSSPKMLQKQLPDKTDCAREAKRPSLNQSYPLTQAPSSERRPTQIECRTSNSFHNCESEDLLTYATKDSSISLFLSHLTGGINLSDSSDRLQDGISHMRSPFHGDLLSSRENLPFSTSSEIDEPGKASAVDEFGYSKDKRNVSAVNADNCGNMVGNNEVNRKQIEDRRVLPSVISGHCLHSFPLGTGNTSLFSNQPFKSLHKGPEANSSNKHGKMAFLEDGDHFSHIIHGSENRASHWTDLSGCQNSEDPITRSSTSSCYISETSCLSCKQDIGLSQQAVDGKLRLLAFESHESLMDKQEQVSRPFKMKSQHGRLCCLSSMEIHRNSCKNDHLEHKEGTYCSIHGNVSNLHSLSSCMCNNEVDVLHCKYGSSASHKCCNCPSLARSNSPCSTFSSCHACGTGRHLCFRPREISNDTSLENVEHEMCIYKGGNLPFSGKSCCAVISKCLGGCCLGGAVNQADAMFEENVDGRVKHLYPICDRDAAFQKGRIVRLDQCKCLKENVVLLDNFQTGSSKDASDMIIGYSAATHGNHAKVSEAPGVDRLAEIASEESDSTFKASTSFDEQQMSNLCSGSAAPAVTEVSIEVNKRDVQLSNAEATTAFHYSEWDEGSGIGKCSSFDEVPGARKFKEVPDINFKVVSSKSRPYCMSSHSSGNLAGKFKFRGSTKQKRVRNKTTCGCPDQENNFQGQQFTSVHELLKRKEYLKQDRLNVSAPNSDFLLAHSQPDSMDELKNLLPSSKRDKAFMLPENVIGGTCSDSSGSSNIKQKRSDLSSSKFISLKKLEKYHNANKTNNFSSNTNKHFEESKASVLMEEKLNITAAHDGKCANQRLSHHNGEKPPRYMSLSCIRDSRNHEMETSPLRKRPVVCGNSGIISSGELDSQQKPARIVPLTLILKRAKRCRSDWEAEPKKLISDMADAKEQHCGELASCKSQDDSESQCIGRKSEVDSGELFFLGTKYQFSKSGYGKAIKCAWAGSLRSRNNSVNNKADAGQQMEINKTRSSRSETFSFDANALCCVCGSSYKEDINYLLECNQCMIRVHMACYGISKVPKCPWYCRPCKTNSKNIACVLCGYEGGAMTQALKSTNIVKSLLKVWKATVPSNQWKLRRFESVEDEVLKESSQEVEAKSDEHGFLSVGLISSDGNPAVAVKIGKHNQNSNMQEPDGFSNKFDVQNTIIEGVLEPSVIQWVHVVCGLWTPGTRCPNVDTMNAFEVCGASPARRNIICSMCCRPGGSCIKCRVTNCSIHFHPWCAHKKGLLQCETEGEDNEKVGFYGKCMLHAKNNYHSADNQLLNAEAPSPRKRDWTCARTEGFKGRDGSFNPNYQNAFNDGDGCNVSQVQINAWHHINGQKSCTRGGVKPACSDVEYDLRKEYIRYKLSKGWKHLVVYKSGIHALGLYTSQFIAQGAMVVEYVGEIVGLRVADKRETEYQSGQRLQCKSACYFFRIDKEHIIDATRKGGIARFVNHSCLPNCVAKIISIRNEKKVVFIAERDIYPGEEITYDYHFNREDEVKKIPCFCNSKNCRRYLN